MSTFSTCTSSTRPGSPANGDVLFETDTKNVILWDGTNWQIYNNDGSNTPTFPNVYSAELADGVDDRVAYNSTSGNQTSLGAFTGDMSFVLWFKQNSSPKTYEVIISSHNHLTSYDGVQGKFDMDIQSGGTLRIFSRDSGAGGFNDLSAGSVVNNSWNFIAQVFDSSASAHYTYIGQSSTSPTLKNTISSSQTLEDFANGFKLGDGNQPNLSGYVDDFAIFNGKALSSSEITTIWNNGASFDYSSDATLNPVGWYRMGDDNSGTGTAIQNKVNTGSSYDASLQNGASFSTTIY
mgnify:CR=1 FL=1